MGASEPSRKRSSQTEKLADTDGKLKASFHPHGSNSVTQIFVSGTWKASKAAAYREQGWSLGQFLARAGVNLACGPGTGIARHVIDGFRSELDRGIVRYYLPLRAEMEKVGETVEDGADEIVETDFDYPMRNVWQVKQSHGVFVLTGGDGTLEEVLPAIIDYGLPVAVVGETGTAAVALRRLVEIYPAWAKLLRIGPDVDSIAEPFIEQVRATQRSLTRDVVL
jgi:predicted Rossmann-fold nucleotide-binding protein